MSAQRAAHRRQKKSSDVHSQKQPLRPLYVATLTPLTEHFQSLFPDVRQGNAISRMEQFTTMDTRSGNTATAVSGFTERPSPFNFPQQSRLPHIAHQNPFLPHLQHNPNTVIPTQTLPLFQLKHSRHNHAYKASQTLPPQSFHNSPLHPPLNNNNNYNNNNTRVRVMRAKD